MPFPSSRLFSAAAPPLSPGKPGGFPYARRRLPSAELVSLPVRAPKRAEARGGGFAALDETVSSTVSSSGLPSSRKMKSYWRESSGGLQGW